MPINPKEVAWIEEPQLGVLNAMYLPAVASGLATTVRHMFTKTKTRQYPEEQPDVPANYRGVHRLNRDDQGRVKCVACFLCATACPAHCIEIEAEQSPWTDRDKYPKKFVIDQLRCIYCGMCEQACPVDAIELTSIYNLTGHDRESMFYDREKLLSIFDETSGLEKDPVRTQQGVLGPASEIHNIQAKDEVRST